MKVARWMTLAAPVLTVACHDGILLGGGGAGAEADAMVPVLDASATPIPPPGDAGKPLDAEVPYADASPALDAPAPIDATYLGDAGGGPNVWAFGNPVDGGKVFGVNANGGAVVLVSGTSSQDVGLHVTQNADTVFYVAEDSGDGGDFSYSLHSVPLQGGPSRTLVSGLGPVTAIVADASDLYFGFSGTFDGGVYGSIQRIAVSGGAPEAVVAAGAEVEGLALGAPQGVGVQAQLYWTQRDGANTGSVWWVNEYTVGGVGYPMPLIQNQPLPSAVAVRGGDVYWLHTGTMQIDCTPTDGTLVELPYGTSQPETLLSSLQGVRSLAVAGGDAYVATAGSFCNTSGTGLGLVRRFDLASATTTTLASALTGPDNLFVSGSSLYLTTVIDANNYTLGVSILGR